MSSPDQTRKEEEKYTEKVFMK